MQRLDRPVAPACLTNYRHGVDRWASNCPTHAERNEIWVQLDAMQHGRCAYCEKDLSRARHIEHFRQRRSYPQGTFAWDNLFGSCDRTDSCGKHKDACGPYEHAELIKPDVDDPERYLVFVATGAVQVRANLASRDRRKAEETIRVFNLNGALKQIRRAVLLQYLETAEDLTLMAAEYGDAEVLPMLEEELRSVAQLPHATAIRHLLTRQSPALSRTTVT